MNRLFLVAVLLPATGLAQAQFQVGQRIEFSANAACLGEQFAIPKQGVIQAINLDYKQNYVILVDAAPGESPRVMTRPIYSQVCGMKAIAAGGPPPVAQAAPVAPAAPDNGAPVKIPSGAEFKSSNECTPGRNVTVASNPPYDPGGAGVVVKKVDEMTCLVNNARTGKQSYVIYWNMAAPGAVAHYPERVAEGNYGCVTFAGVVSVRANVAGRPEMRPLFDVRVTGPGTYVGADGVRGTFTYDKSRGEVRFSGGSHGGKVAGFVDNGGQGKFVFHGENGEIGCGL